ncbi:MAG: surface lipoprotein assembly modifier [Sphingomonas sp.]
MSRASRRLDRTVAIAAFGIFASASPAAAQEARTGLSATDVFVAAEQAKASGHTAEALVLYDALSRDPDLEVRSEARFRKGMLLAEGKHYIEAAVAFRALLDEKPGAARVRLELARVLAAMGDERGARRSLQQAQATGLPPEVALVVDQFANALRSTRKIGGSFEAALAPDSNVNRATSARTLDTIIAPLTLSDDARAKSGIGIKLAGQGYARIPLSSTLAALPRLSARGNFYRAGEFNDVSGSALIGLEWRGKRDRVTPSIGPTWRWYGGKPYANTQALTIDWLHAASRRTQITISSSASRSRYSLNTLQDGALFNLGMTIEHATSARGGIGVSASATRQTARDPGYATMSEGAAIFGWREMGKMTVFASAGLHRLDGDARLFLFPDRRREWLYQVSGSATLRQLTLWGFAPLVRVGWERNVSTVGIYDYRRLSADFGITRGF